MLGVTTTFAKYLGRKDWPHTFLVILETGSAMKFYFSDRRINLSISGEKFEGVVKSWGSIRQSTDLADKRSALSNFKITVSNAPYKRDGSGWRYLSEELGGYLYINRKASVYLWFEGITDLADCLKIFEGRTLPMEDVTPEGFSLTIIERSFQLEIPRNAVNASDFPKAPPSQIGLKIPLVYGNFDFDDDLQGVITEGRWISANKAVFSDHPLKEIANVWVLDSVLQRLVRLDAADYTVDIDDDGRGTVEITDMNATDGTVYIWPQGHIVINDYGDTGAFPGYPMVNCDERVYDQDSASYGQFQVPANTVYPTYSLDGLVKWYFPQCSDAGAINNMYMECNYLYHDAAFQDAYPLISWPVGGASGIITLDYNGDDTYKAGSLTGVGWTDIGTVGRYMQAEAHYTLHDPPSTLKITLDIREVRLRVNYRIGIKAGWRIFIECKGRTYGAYIDEGGRTNSANSGDMIDLFPAVIENILRQELGFASSDIDIASFDVSMGELASWNMALSLTEAKQSDDLFRELGLQSKSSLIFATQNKAALLTLKTVTEVDTLALADISTGGLSLEFGELRDLVNDITVNYYPDSLTKTLRRQNTGINSTSQTSYNAISQKKVDAPQIILTSVAILLKNHYIGTSALWTNVLRVLNLEMFDWQKIKWEVGDIILPDSSLNNTLREFSAFWGAEGSALMMVTGKTISATDLKFVLTLVDRVPIT